MLWLSNSASTDQWPSENWNLNYGSLFPTCRKAKRFVNNFQSFMFILQSLVTLSFFLDYSAAFVTDRLT